MSDGRRIRVALVGLGQRAFRTYLPLVLSRSRHMQLVAVVDPDTSARARFVEATAESNLPQYSDDVQLMMTETHPDIVIIASPDHLHSAQAIAVLQHGTDVFCEKPIGISTADVSRTIRAARYSKANIAVGHNLRFHELHQRVKALIDEGRIGQVITASMTYFLLPGHGESYFRR